MIKQNIGGNASGEKKFGGLDYLKITIFGFALTALWSSLGRLILWLVIAMVLVVILVMAVL